MSWGLIERGFDCNLDLKTSENLPKYIVATGSRNAFFPRNVQFIFSGWLILSPDAHVCHLSQGIVSSILRASPAPNRFHPDGPDVYQ